MRRDDAVLDDLLLVINVVQEKIQRDDALREATFEIFPFLGRNNARHEIERKNTLGAAGIAIDVERHALAKEREIHRMAFGVKILASQAAEGGIQFFVMAENLSVAPEHFVEQAI